MASFHYGHYGADRHGLVYGYAFGRDGIGHAIELDELDARLGACRTDAAGFLWLHFDGAHAATKTWLSQNLELPDEFVELLRTGSESTRVELAGGGLLAVISDIIYELKVQTSRQVATLYAYVGPPHILVSVRNHPLRSVDRLRQAVNAKEPFSSPLALLSHLLRDQADVLAQISRDVTEKVDRLEDSFLGDGLPNRSELGRLRRELVRMQRLLAPEPGALFRILNRPPGWVGAEVAEDLRQATEEFSVVLRDMASVQERIKLLQEETVALVGERTNRSVFVLTAVTVIALPINLTAGLLGMNVGGVPFGQHSAGFWIVLGFLIVATVLVAWAVMRLRVR